MTISLAGFHLETMADAAIYFIRHDEAQLHSTWGALGQTSPKSTLSKRNGLLTFLSDIQLSSVQKLRQLFFGLIVHFSQV